MSNQEKRKSDHITLTDSSQMSSIESDQRFYYEPLFGTHSDDPYQKEQSFLGKTIKAPLWVSSMTGGSQKSGHINRNLARGASEFGLGMGLGSCRPLLESDEFFDDFNMRPILGDDLPLFANLGIAQVDQLLVNGQSDKILKLISKLQADGIIIHVNPLQEWFQPEGDQYKRPAIDTIEHFLEYAKDTKVIVKEVGQGFGPKSLGKLMRLPLAAIDFAAFGGTNFSKLESLRNSNISSNKLDLVNVGHSAKEMVIQANLLIKDLKDRVQCSNVIISGGIKNFLDGFYLCELYQGKAVYGQAKSFLDHSTGEYETLRTHILSELEGLKMANEFLTIRNGER